MAVEVAEAVVGALKGELAATAVNAPMVPAEVLNPKHLPIVLNCGGRLAANLFIGGSKSAVNPVTKDCFRAEHCSEFVFY